MKLDKAICKRCVNETPLPECERGERVQGWTEDEEDDWRLGWVACPELLAWPVEGETCGYVNQGPPAYCPYTAEHVVS